MSKTLIKGIKGTFIVTILDTEDCVAYTYRVDASSAVEAVKRVFRSGKMHDFDLDYESAKTLGDIDEVFTDYYVIDTSALGKLPTA